MSVNFDGLDTLGDVNAFLEPLVTGDPTELFGTALPQLDSCLTRLALSLARAQKAAGKNSQDKGAVLDALATPFNEIKSALNDLFNVGDVDLDDDATLSDAIKAYTSSFTEALRNPVAAFVQSQKDAFNFNMQQLGSVFMGRGDRKGYFDKVWDKTHFMFTQLFINVEGGAENMGGMVWYALSEVMPAIDVELRYLKRMKKAVYTSIEEVSSIPPNMQPGVPNLWGTVKMCEIEEHLRRVATDLRDRSRWNRSEFKFATEKACATAEVLKSGILPEGSREFLKGTLGWNDKQLNAIKDFKFLPNVKFRAKLIELTALNNFLQEQDRQVIYFHRNLQKLMDRFQQLVSLDLGDVLALIIDMLLNHVIAIRADLEAQARGFQSSGDQATGQGQAPDLLTHLASQGTNYVALSALCFIMERTQSIQNAITRLVDFNHAMLRAIERFVGYYKGSDCGSDEGAAAIDDSIQSFLRAVDARLRGQGPADRVLTARGREVLRRIEAHEKFLVCIRDRMFLGQEEILGPAMAVTNAYATVKNIIALVKRVPELYDRITSLELLNLDEDGLADRSALDAIVQGLQCLVLRCDNPWVTSIASKAQKQFEAVRDESDAQSLDIGSLEELATASRKSSLSAGFAAFMKLYENVQKLLNLDLTLLCDIDTTAKPKGNSPAEPLPGTDDLSGDTEDRALQRRREELARREAADQAQGFGPSM